MALELPAGNPPDPAKSLPPVSPPSGKHIVQLFVVPGIIVFGVLIVFWGFTQLLSPWLFGVSRTPNQFLANLESSNADVRWRAANDLAQHLKRDDLLASDVGFGLKLNELLVKALDDFVRAETAFADASQKSQGKAAEREKADMQAKRNYALFLCACLGSMNIHVGAPLLNDVAVNGRGKDLKSRILLQRRAVWALANLGDNQKRYDALPQSRKDAVLAELKKEAEQTQNADRAKWAAVVLAAMEGKGKLGVVAALAETAKADDQFLRNLTAVALTFWEGDDEEKALGEKVLMQLARDVGKGESLRIGEND